MQKIHIMDDVIILILDDFQTFGAICGHFFNVLALRMNIKFLDNGELAKINSAKINVS